MGSQVPLRILCLDGGGVKGLSSLHILKELMAQIRRNKQARNGYNKTECLRPCDYFDLICGIGTGGLLAIMLGRLQYDVDTAIKKYVALAKAVFGTNSTEDHVLFDAATLEKEIKKVIKAAPDGSKEDAMFEDPRVEADTNKCRTFVLASRPEGSGKSAVRMRTYYTKDNDAFDAQIWQVARATSAAPTYFSPIEIKGIRYGDGRIGWNNPTLEAINETDCIWPGRPIACVVSAGTGLEDALQLAIESRVPSATGPLGQFPLPLNPKQAFDLAVAEYCVVCVTSCERTHGQIASNLKKFGIDGLWQYVRLNVPQGMARIGLQEWKKIPMIAALAEDYMEDVGLRELKRQVAERLSSPENYIISNSEHGPDPTMGPPGNIRYAMAQRQIEARGAPTTNVETGTNFLPNIRDRGGAHSNALVRKQLILSRQQQTLVQQDCSESSSDESGRGWGSKQLKRNDLDMHTAPSPVPRMAEHGHLRLPTLLQAPISPTKIYSLEGIPRAPQFKNYNAHCNEVDNEDGNTDEDVYEDGNEDVEGDYDDLNDETFGMEFDNDGLSAIVLGCDYPRCQPMGALQKDYLRDHYIRHHNEFLIKPSAIIPSATPRTCSRSWRCSACLRKLTAENQGRPCDNCRRTAEAVQNDAANNQSGTVSNLEAKNGSMHSLSSRVEAIDSQIATTSAQPSSESLEEEENPSPQPSIWIPAELPEHWTSYTPSTPTRINVNTGYSRTRPISSSKNPHAVSASARKAKEEHRRQRLHQQKA